MFNKIRNNEKRTHESPMDWEWQTKGPTDPHSPFPQFKPQEGRKPIFESQTPQKFQNPTSSFIASSSTPAPQFRNPSFTTPRKPFDPELFSEASGAESTPGDIDADVDTPEISKISTAMAVLSPSDKKPLFGRYGTGFLGSSPGRADLRRGKLANTITHKLRKRKRIDRETKAIGNYYSDSESDSGESRPRSKKGNAPEENKPGWFATLMSGIESRPHLPNVLATYIQFFTNALFLLLTIFGFWMFISTIKEDIDKAAQDSIAEEFEKIQQCTRDYVANKCGHDQRVPGMRDLCSTWEVCMGRDANKVGRARVSAHTFAGILNSFVEPISYKAMIFIVVAILVVVMTNNLAFGMFRARNNDTQMPTAQPYFPAPPNNYNWGAPPQTPSHQHTFTHDTWGQEVRAIMPSHTPSGRRSPSKSSQRSLSKAYKEY